MIKVKIITGSGGSDLEKNIQGWLSQIGDIEISSTSQSDREGTAGRSYTI